MRFPDCILSRVDGKRPELVEEGRSPEFGEILLERLANVLALTTIDGQRPHFDDVLDGMEGAFPSDVYWAISTSGRDVDFSPTEDEAIARGSSAPQAALPPEHPAVYDWRFHEDDAQTLADHAKALCRRVNPTICCLGVPTVAMALLQDNWPGHIEILDISTPSLNSLRKIRPEYRTSISQYNVEDPLPFSLYNSADVVVMDPPWYLDYYTAFIQRGRELLRRPSGWLLLPQFPRLCRSGASRDQEMLRVKLNKMGCLEGKELFEMRYRMPRFEETVLKPRLPLMARTYWRHTKMAAVRLPTVADSYSKQIPLEPVRWGLFGDDGEVLAVRDGPPERLGQLFDTAQEWCCYDSVSRSDPRRPNILVWRDKNECIYAA